MSTLALQEHQVIAVHDLAAVVVAERRLDAVAAEAADANDLLRAVVGDTAGDAAAVAVRDRYRVAALEAAGHVVHAGRQEAPSLLAQGLAGAGVHGDAPLEGEPRDHPALAALHAVDARGEEGAERLPAHEPQEDVRLPPIGDDDVGAAGERELRRLELRGHPADAAAARIGRPPLDPGVDALHAGGEGCGRAAA